MHLALLYILKVTFVLEHSAKNKNHKLYILSNHKHIHLFGTVSVVLDLVCCIAQKT